MGKLISMYRMRNSERMKVWEEGLKKSPVLIDLYAGNTFATSTMVTAFEQWLCSEYGLYYFYKDTYEIVDEEKFAKYLLKYG